MALIACPDCGNDVSSEAKACPSCARPIAEKARADNGVGAGQFAFDVATGPLGCLGCLPCVAVVVAAALYVVLS